MDHIYSGFRLCSGLWLRNTGYYIRVSTLRTPHDTSDIRLLLPGTYHYAPHTTLEIYHHYKYDILPVSISFPHPSIS